MNLRGRALLECLAVALGLARSGMTAEAPVSVPEPIHTWQRWEHALTSTRHYDNPHANAIVRVTYKGPSQRTLRTYGFWDGSNTFRIRCAFPAPGTWQWETECTDASNTGLHRQRGKVYPSLCDKNASFGVLHVYTNPTRCLSCGLDFQYLVNRQ